MNNIEKLRHDLEELKETYGKCPDMFCTTCGGYGHHTGYIINWIKELFRKEKE